MSAQSAASTRSAVVRSATGTPWAARIRSGRAGVGEDLHRGAAGGPGAIAGVAPRGGHVEHLEPDLHPRVERMPVTVARGRGVERVDVDLGEEPFGQP